MPRQYTRSQRPSQPSQSQPPRGTQGRRGRKSRADEDEDEEMENENEGGEQQEIVAEKAQQDLDRKARDLVRLALFHEQRRTPLKRDEISKKVLGTSSRSFNVVFAAANAILQKTFGMELVELHSTAADKEISEKDAEMLKTAGVKKKATSTGTKNYILRSLLDAVIIEKALSPDAEIRELEQSEHPDANEEFAEDDNTIGTRSTGSIFAWHNADQLPSVGILYVILALILVEGRVINDNDLHNILKRLQLPANGPVPLSSQSSNQGLTIDAHLAQLTRQGYLEKHRVGNTRAGGGNKRGRASQHANANAANDDGTLAAYEWRWGPRAMAEVGERAVAQFVAEFMAVRAGGEDDADEDAVRAPDDEDTRKRVQSIFKGIERAASGAPLADVR